MAWYDFLTGTREKREQVSRLTPEQQKLQSQAIGAGEGRGAGGAFGQSADYYRDLLSNDSQDFQAFAAPEMRNFRENIIPGLSEQFAGMGAGGLSSSGFQNSAVNAGTDLSERLGAIRAALRQQGAQGLTGIGQQGLQQTADWQTTQPGSEGLLGTISPLAGAVVSAYGGPAAGAAVQSGLGQFGGNKISGKGNSSPYGNQQSGAGYKGSFGGQLPMFGAR